MFSLNMFDKSYNIVFIYINIYASKSIFSLKYIFKNIDVLISCIHLSLLCTNNQSSFKISTEINPESDRRRIIFKGQLTTFETSVYNE